VGDIYELILTEFLSLCLIKLKTMKRKKNVDCSPHWLLGLLHLTLSSRILFIKKQFALIN
jgi:hypothetical protein